MTRIGRVGYAPCASAVVLAVSNARPAAKQLNALLIKPLPGACDCGYPRLELPLYDRLSASGLESSMEFDLSESSLLWRDCLQAFFDKEVLPRHRDWSREVAATGTASFMPERQRRPRSPGLWNLALPELATDEP